jgi:plastocyanin
VALGAATLCVVSLVTVQAQAAPTTFLELEGNVVFNGTGTYDWANGHTANGVEDSTLSRSNNGAAPSTYTRSGSGGLFDGGVYNGNTTPPTAPARTGTDSAIPDAEFKVDPLSVDNTSCPQTGDPTVYTGAGSETNGDPLSTDTFGTGSVPNKDDLSNVYAAAHISGSTSEVFFGAERVINNGDSHMDFEFLQGTVSIPNACSGSFTGNRTQGDFLLAVDFTQGGALGGSTLYRWQCDVTFNAAHNGQVCNPLKSGNKGAAHYAVTGTTAVTLLVNGGGDIPCGGWVCRNPDGTPSTTILKNELLEGGIDLQQLGFTGCVSTFLPHTRSSQSFTATLKDFEVIPFNTCRRPTITTQIKNGAGTDVTNTNQAVGTILHDTAALHDNTADAGGTVTYTMYTAADCGGTATDLTPTDNAVVNGVVPDSRTFTFNNVGTYYFEATYSGDVRNLVPAGGAKSGCNAEPVTIIPNTPTVSTKIKNASGTDVTGTTQNIGTVLHDTATIAGATPTAGGSITYKLFSDNACTAANLVATLTPDSSATADDVINGVAPDSKTFTFTNAGSYWFYAVYSGDANNTGPVNSGCASEPITIRPNTTTTTTAIRNAAGADVTNTSQVIGTILHDTATISGATATAGGTITYTLYTALNCGGTATDLTPVTNAVVNGAAPDSRTFTFTNAGTYYFKATYSGDTNNVGSNSGCNAEPVTISPNAPVPHSTPVVQIKDTFSVTGLTSDATGNVLIGVYSAAGCAAANRIAGTSDSSFLVTGNVVSGAISGQTTFMGAPAGSYFIKISYAGDNNNTGFSDCTESTTVSITSKA